MNLKSMWSDIEAGDKQTLASILFGVFVSFLAIRMKSGFAVIILGLIIPVTIWWVFVGRPKYTAKGAHQNERAK
jgi:hypothetical protein